MSSIASELNALGRLHHSTSTGALVRRDASTATSSWPPSCSPSSGAWSPWPSRASRRCSTTSSRPSTSSGSTLLWDGAGHLPGWPSSRSTSAGMPSSSPRSSPSAGRSPSLDHEHRLSLVQRDRLRGGVALFVVVQPENPARLASVRMSCGGGGGAPWGRRADRARSDRRIEKPAGSVVGPPVPARPRVARAMLSIEHATSHRAR